MVGGVLATIQAEEIEKATGVKPHKGVLNIPGQLDKGDDKIIDKPSTRLFHFRRNRL